MPTEKSRKPIEASQPDKSLLQVGSRCESEPDRHRRSRHRHASRIGGADLGRRSRAATLDPSHSIVCRCLSILTCPTDSALASSNAPCASPSMHCGTSGGDPSMFPHAPAATLSRGPLLERIPAVAIHRAATPNVDQPQSRQEREPVQAVRPTGHWGPRSAVRWHRAR